MNSILTTGSRNGKLVRIEEVEKGLACECVCPHCGEKLIALKSNGKPHRFEHFREEECGLNAELSLEEKIKHHLEKQGFILTPPATVRFSDFSHVEWPIAKEKKVQIKSVRLETIISESNILIDTGNRTLILDIKTTKVTSQKDRWQHEQKLIRCKKSGYSVMELDFSKIEGFPSTEELESILFKNDSRKKWLFNQKAEKVRSDMQKISAIKNLWYACDAVEPKGLGHLIYNHGHKARTCSDCFYCVGGKRGKVLCSKSSGIKNFEGYKTKISEYSHQL